MPKHIDESGVRAALQNALETVKGVADSAAIEGSKRLVELDVDSLDLIEMGMLVEQEFDVVLDGASFDGVETVDELVSVLCAALTK